MRSKRLPTADPRTNRLLASLASEDYDELMRYAKIVYLRYRSRLYRQDEAIKAVYFPLGSMVSIIVGAERRSRIEIATIGREGVVGVLELISEGAIGAKLVQLPGPAVRVDVSTFRKLEESLPQLRSRIDLYLHVLMRQIVLTAECNMLHSMEERCARWLLLTHDSASQDTFPLTQEFLATMLGVRRATVTVATGMLKKAGFISYLHGKITIVDRAGLEVAGCECYAAGRRAYNTILSNTPEHDPVVDACLTALALAVKSDRDVVPETDKLGGALQGHVMDPKIWTRKRPVLRWSGALKMEERQCHERVRITRPA